MARKMVRPVRANQPDEGDESDDPDEPGVGRKVPRHTAHEEYKADRYLEYPREPVELAPAEAHHGAHVVPANCQCPGALPPQGHLHRLHLNPALFLGLPCCVPPRQTSPPVATKSMECLLWSQVSPPYPAKI